MCGIVGVVCKSHFGFNQKQVDMFEQLLRADELRGEDSTGLIYVTNDASFGILKEASPASWSASQMLKDNLLSDKIRKGKVLIGHNRKATVGRVTDETAHPFVVDNTFAMVHNGTLRQHHKLKETEVDSEALAHVFAGLLKTGVEQEHLEEEMGKVEGAFATASFQQAENRVYLLRNNERPLYFLELSDCFIWGSEAGMVLWIAGRNGYDLSKLNGYVVKDHSILSINLANNSIEHREFVPKKAISPVTKTTGVIHSTKTTLSTNKGGMSKQEFKKLKRRFLGTKHTFFVDDWVESTFPAKQLADGAEEVILLGEFNSDVFSYVSHSARAQIKIADIFKDSMPEDFCNVAYSGTITEMYNNVNTGQIDFYLDGVAVFPSSNITTLSKKVLETTQQKWTALPPPEKHPDDMDTDEWKNAARAYRYDYTTKKWIARETSTTVH